MYFHVHLLTVLSPQGMMPCVDMANHASGHATAALYETDDDGNGLLLLRDGKQLSQGGEVTIT